jgi:hypothetical protein
LQYICSFLLNIYFLCIIIVLMGYQVNLLSFSCQNAVGQSATPGAVLRPPVPHVIEVTGSESPSTFSWNSRNHRARHDLSRARLRAIESSLENGQVWIPPSPAHRKTWEEEVRKASPLCIYIDI